MVDLAETISKNLKREIDKNDITQKELAKTAGIDETQLGRYIKGRHLPRVDQIGKIAEALKVSPAELLMTDEERATWEKAKTQSALPPDVRELRESLHALAEVLDYGKLTTLLALCRADLEALMKKKSG